MILGVNGLRLNGPPGVTAGLFSLGQKLWSFLCAQGTWEAREDGSEKSRSIVHQYLVRAGSRGNGHSGTQFSQGNVRLRDSRIDLRSW